MTDEAHVVVLMGVYNGARDLPEQLESLLAQKHRNWSLIASDDGSTDDSRRILEAFRPEGHQITVLDGPREGTAGANFMSLLRRAPTLAPAGSWLAFSDQDDVWLPERLSKGIADLSRFPEAEPALHCSRTLIVDERLRHPRLSPPRPRPLGFRNALVQNVASGNTILLNPSAARLVMTAAEEAGEISVHDWWCYLLLAGSGAHLIHDDRPALLYRQHRGNVLGANDFLAARLARLQMLAGGTLRQWTEANIRSLENSSHRLTAENRALLEAFAEARHSPLPGKLQRLSALGLYRQGRVGTAAIMLSALFGLL